MRMWKVKMRRRWWRNRMTWAWQEDGLESFSAGGNVEVNLITRSICPKDGRATKRIKPQWERVEQRYIYCIHEHCGLYSSE